jgi:hypothetical protein
MKKVILVGTSHTIQRGNSKAQEFESYIKELCSSYNVNAIAEEIDNKDNYICFDICKDLNIKYKIIEPTEEEKQKLGILTLDEIDKYMHHKYLESEDPVTKPILEIWPKNPSKENLPEDIYNEYESASQNTYRQREEEWLNRIVILNTWPVLVICGADHYEPFKKLLTENNFEVISKNNRFGLEE